MNNPADQEHNEWRAEHLQWKEDMATWREQLDEMILLLKKVENFVRSHEEDLESHEEAILKHETHIKNHEAAFLESGKQGETSQELMNAHKEEGQRHFLQSEKHESLKKAHIEHYEKIKKLAEELNIN